MLRVGSTGDWIGTFVGHKGSVWASVLSSDGRVALTASADYSAKLWDCASGDELATFAHPKIVRAVAISPGTEGLPRRALTAGAEGVVRLFDCESHQTSNNGGAGAGGAGTGSSGAPQALRQWPAHSGTVRRLVWRDEHTVLSCGGDDKHVRLWDLRAPIAAASDAVRQLAFASDVKDVSVARGHSAGTAPLLAVAAGRTVAFVNSDDLAIVKQHDYPFELNSAALNQKSQRFIAGGEDFSAKVLDYESGDLLEVHKGHHGAVHCVRFAPDLETYSSSSEDGTIRLWQCEIKNYGLWLVTSPEAPPAAPSAPAKE